MDESTNTSNNIPLNEYIEPPTWEDCLETLDGVDFSDDTLFYTHTWRDETSQFDTHPSVRWEYGGEYYSREYKTRVPIAFKNCPKLIQAYLNMMLCGEFDGMIKGLWVD